MNSYFLVNLFFSHSHLQRNISLQEFTALNKDYNVLPSDNFLYQLIKCRNNEIVHTSGKYVCVELYLSAFQNQETFNYKLAPILNTALHNCLILYINYILVFKTKP